MLKLSYFIDTCYKEYKAAALDRNATINFY